MSSCPTCHGNIRYGATACPNCRATVIWTKSCIRCNQSSPTADWIHSQTPIVNFMAFLCPKCHFPADKLLHRCKSCLELTSELLSNCHLCGRAIPLEDVGGYISHLSVNRFRNAGHKAKSDYNIPEVKKARRKGVLSRRFSQRKHDKSLMKLHQETVKERGFSSVIELRSYLAKARNEEYRQMLERTNGEAEEARKSENLKNFADKAREAQSKRSKKISKEIYDSILNHIHGKMKMKLNPDVGEAITQEEMVEAFQHAGRLVNATTELTDEHRRAVWDQIGKFAQTLLNEADWDVSAPTPMGP